MNRPPLASWIRRLSAGLVSTLGALAVLMTSTLATTAEAQGLFDHPKYASIVVDANTGEVLYALRADQPRVPASITKILTLYLAFEALETGRVKVSDPITVSPHCVGMIPVKSGLRAGEQLTVDEATRLIAILSANDIACAMGEHLAGGSEAKFASLMTLRAQELGMTGSHFVNASGVPDPGNHQTTTAKDIAVLARAVMRDYPQYYSYFSQKEFTFRGRTLMNHNHLLLRMPGVDGLKTGFTNAAGYNLAASALRDGRRLITVVLGGSSTAARDENVENLLSAGFQVLASRASGQSNLTLAQALGAPDEINGALIRPSTEVGSGDQDGLKVAAADPLHLPGTIADAMMAPVALQPAALRTPTHTECERFRRTIYVSVRVRRHRYKQVPKTIIETACHQSSAPMKVLASAGGSTGSVDRTPVDRTPAVIREPETTRVCTGRGRHRSCHTVAARSEAPRLAQACTGRGRHRHCHAVTQVAREDAAPAAARTCTGRGRHRVCHTATQLAREDAAPAARTCTGRGRHRVCHAAAEHTAVAAAHLRGCTGRAAKSRACRAEAEAAETAPRHGRAKPHGRQAAAAAPRHHHVTHAG